MSLVNLVHVFGEKRAREKFYFCFSSDYSRLFSLAVQTDDFFDARIRVSSLVNKVQPPFMPSSRIGQSDWLSCLFFCCPAIGRISLANRLLFISVHACSDSMSVDFENFSTGQQREKEMHDNDRPPASLLQLSEKKDMEIDPNIPFGNPLPASQRLDPSRCVDLIVLGINYRSNEEDVRQYFQQFGELVFCEVSRHPFASSI